MPHRPTPPESRKPPSGIIESVGANRMSIWLTRSSRAKSRVREKTTIAPSRIGEVDERHEADRRAEREVEDAPDQRDRQDQHRDQDEQRLAGAGSSSSRGSAPTRPRRSRTEIAAPETPVGRVIDARYSRSATLRRSGDGCAPSRDQPASRRIRPVRRVRRARPLARAARRAISTSIARWTIRVRWMCSTARRPHPGDDRERDHDLPRQAASWKNARPGSVERTTRYAATSDAHEDRGPHPRPASGSGPRSSAAIGIRISAPMPRKLATVVSIVRATSADAPLSERGRVDRQARRRRRRATAGSRSAASGRGVRPATGPA